MIVLFLRLFPQFQNAELLLDRQYINILLDNTMSLRLKNYAKANEDILLKAVKTESVKLVERILSYNLNIDYNEALKYAVDMAYYDIAELIDAHPITQIEI